MLRLAMFFSCVAIIGGKLNNFNFSRDVSGNDFKDDKAFDNNEPLWVLKIDEEIWDSLEIRKATMNDKQNFDTFAAPMVDRYLKSRNSVVKKDSAKFTTNKPEARKEDPKEIRTRLLKIINKFLVFKYYDLNNDQLNNSSELTIYFQGPFTTILLQHDVRHWLYFIPPPSPLPSWFYQDHDNIVTGVTPEVVPIPNDVTLELYPSLLSLMEKLLTYPL